MNRNTKEIIKKIEDILLDGKKFDKARKKILFDNSNSFQVQACPGSGKTTLLVAKLMFLAQTIDFSKESICVLTHTNVAVDEIKRKIKKHNKPGYENFINNVYKLFNYPNFIGTIQSFLDKYLGIPCYEKVYGFRPNVIDDDIVKSSIEKSLDLVFYLKNRINLKENIKNGNFNMFEEVFDFDLKIKSTTTTYKILVNIKKNQIKEYKNLKFKEIDYFSLKYLNESNIKGLLQKRFKYVFLDEIQDTHSLQIEILNTLYEGGENIIQGFGDYNQEIFDDGVDGGNFSIFGEDEAKQINNSLRLSSIIAENVKNVCLNPQELKGIDGRKIPIYFIIFDKPEEVIKKYLEIIEIHKDDFVGIKVDNRIFKAIGWAGKEKDGKLYIGSYWNKYNNGKITKSKVNFFAYFQKANEKEFKNKGYSIYKDNIINGILHAFNHDKDNQIKTNEGKFFSKSTFISYLKENNLYNEFKKNIFKFANQIESEPGINWNEVKNYILSFEINGKKLKDDSFLKNDVFGTPEEISNISKDNLNIDGEYKIKFSTIAKVKGETHTGTLVLDTDYNNQNTSKILEFWELDESNKGIKEKGKVNNQKGLKNHYVAITRATHLLCIAVNKDRSNISLVDSICDGEVIIKI